MLAILEAQQESTLDGILVVDNSGRVLVEPRIQTDGDARWASCSPSA